MSFEKTAESLNIEYNIADYQNSSGTELVPLNDDLDEEQDADIEYATETLKTTMAKLTDIFDEVHNLASASESTKAYDSLNAIASNLNQMATNLVKIKQSKRVKQTQEVQAQSITTNNTLICSPSELLKQLNEKELN